MAYTDGFACRYARSAGISTSPSQRGIVPQPAGKAGTQTRTTKVSNPFTGDLRTKIADLNVRLHSNEVEIELFTFHQDRRRHDTAVSLDWTAYFKAGSPTPEVWHDTLLRALADLRETLGTSGIRLIKLYPKARLSAGYAFGYTFRAPAGFQLWIEQFVPTTAQAEWWRTDESVVKDTLLQQENTIVDPGGSDITIEMSIAPDADVRLAAGRHIAEHQLAIRERIHLFPLTATDPAVKDAAHALAMARQVRSTIKKARNTEATQTVHLFGAIPFALAVMIGMQLNTCEPIQCYELKPPKNSSYMPSCLLQQAVV